MQAPPDEELQQLFDDGIAFETDMVGAIVELHGTAAVAIPGRSEADHDQRRALTEAALVARTPIVLGALMPHDVVGRRLGEIDILVATGRTTSAGKAEYRPIDVKLHRCTINLDDADLIAEPAGVVHDLAGLVAPFGADHAVAGMEPRYREDDCLQLAHYHRLLQAHGHAEPDALAPDDGVWAGILGSECVVAWFDLAKPAFNTLTPQESTDDDAESSITFHRRSHSRKRAALDRYDFEFDFRLRVADAARTRTSRDEAPMVLPVAVAECSRCPWEQPCREELAAVDDVSLVHPVGYPEWRVHRFLGTATVGQLAALDMSTALVMASVPPRTLAAAMDWAVDAEPTAPTASTIWAELGDVGLESAGDVAALDPLTLAYASTPLTATALVAHIGCARSAVAGELVVRPDWDAAVVPRGDVEIDLDLESDQHVYLWGARLSAAPLHWPQPIGTYVPFASFEPLDHAGESQLVADLWTWLSSIRARARADGLVVRIYGYNSGSVEGAHLRRIAAALPIAAEVADLVASDAWVDLLGYMRSKYWSNWGHGLKVVAEASGFTWRDADPGGYASLGWYRRVVDAAEEERRAGIERILAYNEDDCAATAALRDPAV